MEGSKSSQAEYPDHFVIEKHVDRLPLNRKAAMSPVFKQNNFRVDGYWMKNVTREQTQSRREGRTPSNLTTNMAFTQQGLSFDGTLPRMCPQNVATAALRMSPRLLQEYAASSTASRTQMSNLKPTSSNISSGQLGSSKHRNLTQRSRKVQGQLKTPSIDGDSIFLNERTPVTLRKHRLATINKETLSSTQENKDSYYRTMKLPGGLGSAFDATTKQKIMLANRSKKKTSNIYSIKDQLMVNNILRKKFIDLKSPTDSNGGDLVLQGENSTMSCDVYSSRCSNVQTQRSTAIYKMSEAPRHIQKQQLLMQQHALSKLTKQAPMSPMSEPSHCLSSESASQTAAVAKRQRRKRVKAWNLVEEIFQPSLSPVNSQHSLNNTGKAKMSPKQKEKAKPSGINTPMPTSPNKPILTGQQISPRNRANCQTTLVSPSKENQLESPRMNYVRDNTRNLFKNTADKLHPTFNVWLPQYKVKKSNEPHYGLDSCASSDLASSSSPQKADFDRSSSDNSECSAIKKKRGLIKEMQKQVRQQTDFNTSEIMLTAGVENKRVKEQEQLRLTAQADSNALIQSSPKQQKEQFLEVAQIIRTMEVVKEENAEVNEKLLNQKKMEGRTKFTIPSPKKLEIYFNSIKSAEKRVMITDIAEGVALLEGKMQLKDYDVKQNRIVQEAEDPYCGYVEKFTNKKRIDLSPKRNARNDFSSQIKRDIAKTMEAQRQTPDYKNSSKQQQVAKTAEENPGMTQTEILESLKHFSTAGEEDGGSIFNRCLEEETSLVGAMGFKFIERVGYITRYAQREVEHEGKGVTNYMDPKVEYFKQCKQDLDLVLPILDKVFQKTLMLQEYTLSQGHCRGLAQACKYFDHTFVNRVFLNNCGIDDVEFSEILKGVNRLKDFKSIIYKANMFGEQSLLHLRPLLLKRLPNHLEELTLIDCHMNTSLVCRLMDQLLDTKCQLRKLSLVNASHSENSFLKIVQFLEESDYLQELDLSWSKLSLMQWRKFLHVVKDNRKLVNLNISYNKILELQPDPTDPVPFSNESWKLTARNQDIVNCLKTFIKYNLHLVTLNLDNTGMSAQTIAHVTGLLRKSQALRCLHLSANEGITPELTEWVRQRIHAKEKIELHTIQPYTKLKKENNKLKNKATIRLGQALFLAKQNKILEQIRVDTQWIQIREGLKLRNVVTSKRMNEVTTYMGDINMEGSFLSKTLVIHRMLGSKHIQPGSAQWVVYDDKKSDCWKCSQSILTIFLWTPRIGKLTCEKDPQKELYYHKKIDEMSDTDDIYAMNDSHTPHITADFNGWRYEKMQEVVPYCQENDLSPPNFVALCKKDGLIKNLHSNGQLSTQQAKVVEMYTEAYYKTNWQDVLLQMMRYKKPQIANAHSLTEECLKYDPQQPVYIHTGWLQPGRHTYCISHDTKLVKDTTEESKSRFSSLFGKSAPEDKIFYVHDMLSTFRAEHIPFFYNPRHVHRITKDQYSEREVFATWILDTPEIKNAILAYDKGLWRLRDLCATTKEYSQLESVIVSNLDVFTDMYRYLQTKSKGYPWLTNYAVRKFFFTPAVAEGGFGADALIYDSCISKADFSCRKLILGTHKREPNVLNRSEFIELIILLARATFANNEGDESTSIPLVRSVQLFLDQCLRKFLNEIKLSWQPFRVNVVQVSEVKLLFTMNQIHLLKLFFQYAARGKGTGFKDHNFQGLVPQDAEQLIIEDAKLLLTKGQVKTAYVLSKMTIVDEGTLDALITYNKLIYVEFLEFLSRIAELYFAGSEMEDLTLNAKLEYLLDELLPIINVKRIKQETVIEEYSDSDDDY